MSLLKLVDAVDIVIDVTGVTKLREEFRQYMQESDNHCTIIMHELIAVLLMSLSQGELVTMKHNPVDCDWRCQLLTIICQSGVC